jgi:hypothetical protein
LGDYVKIKIHAEKNHLVKEPFIKKEDGYAQLAVTKKKNLQIAKIVYALTNDGYV